MTDEQTSGGQERDEPCRSTGETLHDPLADLDALSMHRTEAEAEENIRRLLDRARGTSAPVPFAHPRGGREERGGPEEQGAPCRDAVEADRRRIVAQAQREADELLASARREVARRVWDAEQQAVAIVQEARERARRVAETVGATLPLPRRNPSGGGPAGRARPVPADLEADPEWVAMLWARQVRRLGGPMTPADVTLVPMLHSWVADVWNAALDEADPREAGERTGRALVAAGLTEPEMLGCAVDVLDGHLPVLVAPSPAGRPGRRASREQVTAVLAGLAVGFTHALRALVRSQQEAMLRAVESAHRQLTLTWRDAPASGRGSRALYDPLTGLPNRTMFTERLAAAVDRRGTGRHVGVCLIDLMFFKGVNDRYGTAVGDRLLSAVARRLADLGHLVARLGSDEFAMLVDGCAGSAHLHEIAGQVLAAVEQPLTESDKAISVSARLGLVEAPADQTTPRHLLGAAHAALGKARAEQKPWVLLQPRLNRPVNVPPVGLDPDRFMLHYAPVISLADHRVVGLEALARYDHPHLGLLTPSRVVDLTGDDSAVNDLIGRLLDTACRDAARWAAVRPGHPPYVSVNLPTARIDYQHFTECVREALAGSRLDPGLLRLEVPEQLALPGADGPALVARLSRLGVRLAVDDLGTGYTSLRDLHHLPVAELKFATRLISTFGDTVVDPAEEAVVRALIDLAHRLNLTVTAQGVATRLQADRVTASAFDSAQGLHFGDPLRPDQVPQALDLPHQAVNP